MFVATSALPNVFRSALKEIGYHKSDISVTGAVESPLSTMGGEGSKGFAVIVNVESGEYKVSWGSWGGANIANPGNAVDCDHRFYQIPPNGAVILGSIGGHGTYASILANPAILAPLLPPPSTLSEKQKGILRAYKSLKSGPYRQTALQDLLCTKQDIALLVSDGYLKESSNGAIQITTKGKNAI